ncbi:4-(cytidine 5'-diphospho)-2-C-methyl-D-erythritol kinase [Kitasatospora albolonga]|uniref:4-(cytidine 5'-diphospho)-2-C-methyl-D-erythritol kinase n=1 Tax=Kitasatospora albolonga TaxID=68173 RepID=UPI0035E9294C
MAVTARVPVKINLQLSVGLPGEDGARPLTTVLLAVSVHQTVTAAAHSGLRVTASDRYAHRLRPEGGALALRAARTLAHHHDLRPDVHLHLSGDAPVGGGPGAGTVGAAALLACDLLWGTATLPSVLTRLARTLGTEVPFGLHGGAALATGRGDRLVPVAVGTDTHWVLAPADRPLRSPEVFRRWDELRAAGKVRPPRGSEGSPDRADDRLLAALQRGDVKALARRLTNDLQPAALSLLPLLRRTLDAGLEAGALAALVCGAGSTCVFLAPGAGEALAVAARLRASGLRTSVASGPAYAITTEPASCGAACRADRLTGRHIGCGAPS